ncbi:ribonuclease HII [Periweissella fabaria]|uniref:Ribonuclease HII n=1 Tax=Periweissella fabaria TaxID=546157 RepID=A0ABN8BEN6_9LACO|nr:ribonuclease HII [Periweissella fabaria]MCM0596471.1 ribonuclease HII [Periweissella fabaria]CAH0415801.1 Ribonuclease HII [Periweissella fabaria]
MPKQTIKVIKAQLAMVTSPDDQLLMTLAADERQGVQAAIAQWHRNYNKLVAAKAAFQEHLQIERKAHANGYRLIAGVDEVGRGPLAGPVVAAAVILPPDFAVLGVNDSKQLSDKKRRELAPQIMEHALAVGFGIVDANEIDKINIYEASRVAMKQAVEQLQPSPDYLLVDAMVIDMDTPQEKLIKGDAKSASIGAASIVAKVKRDEIMAAYDVEYPGYGFASNAGYGTATHLAGLAAYGVTPIHRQTFAPVKKYQQD